MLQDIQTIIEIICLIIATSVGVWGLNTWRHEVVGRRKAELAEDVLAMFYEAKDIFSWARFPAAFGTEGVTREAGPNETEEETQYKNSLFVPIERLQKHHEFFGKLQSLRYRFIAYFGAKAADPFDKIKHAHTRIVISARMLVQTRNRRHHNNQNEAQENRWESDIGWWTEESEDSLSTVINEAVEAIELICKPYLSAGKV